MSTGKKILVVDDEKQIRTIVKDRLEKEGYEVILAADGEEALSLFQAHDPDLIILDLMLPKFDGYAVCERIRQRSTVPIIILSAKGDEIDKMVGFRMGVDDYVTKPFSPSELALRASAVLRRSGPQNGGFNLKDSAIEVGELHLDKNTRVVRLRGQPVDLTAKEFDLLWFLASHPKLVFTREQLLAQIWNSDYPGDADNVTVLISRLRGKIEPNPSKPTYIRTVWGVGYKFKR